MKLNRSGMNRPLNQGLVLWLKMSEGAGIRAHDVSGYRNHGTLTGPTHLPTWTDGVSGSAVLFDGIDDYIAMSNLINGIQGTFSIWFKLSQLNVTQYIGSSADEATNQHYFAFLRIDSSNNPTIRLGENADPTNSIRGTTTFEIDTLYHVCTLSDSTQYKIYVNGIEEVLVVDNGANDGKWLDSVTDKDNLVLGVSKKGAPSAYFKGVIGDVRIYNRALSAAEVRQLYLERGYE